ncbi:hypothetical protein HETIRDRAFT_459335 [Heterobasidion irregulare TC 32-1]|uniref:Uncharacterized protein n=1 Tax=Heterobasidion irregulare (strain TC 32-1) TaxID=747525 RepID=W4K499_HETIT|nr:uncharacterized protein HETIRDRAFT_459335 [Heterobasidion irregulare TC 32-1]ETW80574.1 hypothetical protein HETIRDRAFT_459335 [Heterobasidion irregulare TC 32-1]
MRLTCTLLAALSLSLSLSLLPSLTAAQSADECSTPPSGSQCARYCIVCCNAFPDAPACQPDYFTCIDTCAS